MPSRLFLITALCLGALACHSQPPISEAEQQHRDAWLEGTGLSTTHALPVDWLAGSARDFAKNLERWDLPSSLAWNQIAHQELTRVLLAASTSAEKAQHSVRAALLLAHDPTVPSLTNLLIRLERRSAPEQRGRQGVEVVCAAALAKQESLDPKIIHGLLQLATGHTPHPGLDIRVECARAYLAHIQRGDDGKTPIRARASLRFLIQVLRAETPAEAMDPPSWERTRFVAWPKGRAAQELALWFPMEEPFRPDGAWQAQVDWAAAMQHGLGL